ncbi:MAG: RNA polymerase factor sigma-32 [Deltaproteobacteria bacterium]|nr:RNA polymerase factor sigma-32 [Deltaproteobacteria bacterium]MBN2672910.1 RNA polymerase factor sigma-32 [Deltaproteobacteria bacterium]
MNKKKKSSTKTITKRTDSIAPASRASSVSSYDPLDAFLNEIKQYPLLEPDQEKELAEKYQETGDVSMAATLVTSNLRLVVKIAFEYRRAYRNIMDLIQEGNVGLMHAVKKFDPAQGVKLSSYAAWWIRAYILRFVLSNWRLVKLGTTQAQRKLFFNLNKERQRLTSMGIEPTTDVLAERLHVKPREITEMERRMQSEDVSLDVEIGDATGRTVTRGDLLPSTDALQDESLSAAIFNDDLAFHLQNFGKTLSGKEAVVFEDRLISDSPKTLQEIGDQFSVSRERIRQIEKRVMSDLREYLEAEMDGYFSSESGA